jgi:hypothetical protein
VKQLGGFDVKILGSDLWLWINALGMIIFGLIELFPGTAGVIPGIPFAILKIIIALLTILVAFLERDAGKVNGKAWLLFLGVIMFIMGFIPFFPNLMMGIPDLGLFLNSFKVVLGGITLILIIIEMKQVSV